MWFNIIRKEKLISHFTTVHSFDHQKCVQMKTKVLKGQSLVSA